MKTQNNIPALRFPEFDGGFQSKIFDDITEITRLAGYEYSQYWKEDDNEEIIALRGYNIGKGKLDLIKLSYISNELSLQLKRSRLKQGDIVYPCVGSIGNAVVIEENDKFHIQQNIAKITCKKNISPYFIVHFLTSSFGMNEVYRFNASGAQPNVLVGSLRKYRINIPSLPEQQKIASFLSAVDEKIQQLTRKAALLEQYKKGIMQQLFSGTLRFKDDDGKDFPEWEEKKLGDVARITTGSSNRQDSNLDGEYTFFDRSQDIRSSNIFLFDTEAIIVPGEGQEFIPKYFIGKFDLHQRTYAIMEFGNNIGKFLYYYIGYNSNHLNSHAVGSTVKSLRLPMFEKMPIKLPSIKEQQKIASFLSGIDGKIGSVNGQLEKTQRFKKGLLQGMFV